MVGEKRLNLKTKIISTLAGAAFLIIPTITQAHRGSSHRSPHIFRGPYILKRNINSVRNRTRWNPYAFTHKTSGLVSGRLEYNPYAFSHKNPSGLVDRDVRYNPYAFSHKHNGLIGEHSHHPYTRLLSPNDLPCYTIISRCWPIHQPTKNTTSTYQISKRLKPQNKSKIPISEHAKEIYKYLSMNKISFTRKGENFFLPEQKMIIISPDSTLKNPEEHIVKGWTIENIVLNNAS